MEKVAETKHNWSIVVRADGVIVPAIVPVTAIIAIASAIISISYLSMKHRERIEKIKRATIDNK